MSVAGLVDLPLEIFSGLVTDLAASDLPPGASPACSDVAFILGGVLTRPGIGPGAITGLAGNPAVNYQKTFTDLEENQRLLFLDSLGVMRQEYPAGTLTQISAAGVNSPANSYGQSTSLFGREYIAISSAGFGIDLPRQWDTANYDRVSQMGPGLAPSAIDNNQPLSAISRTSGVISGTTTLDHGLSVGGLVTIAGEGADPTFNGTWPVATVGSLTTFTAWANAVAYTITSLSRVGGTVTAMLDSVPFLAAGGGDAIIVAGASDTGFDGAFTTASVSGKTVTWAQAGANKTATGGILYQNAPTIPSQGQTTPIGTLGYLVYADLQAGQVSPFVVGGEVTVASSSEGTWNTTWTIISIQTGFDPAFPYLVRLQVSGTGVAAEGFGGTVTPAIPDSSPIVSGVAGPGGNIPAGVHGLTVSFVTRQGYITKPAPPFYWVATGGFQALISGIPVGPSNIIGRILMFTTSGGATFYYVLNGISNIVDSSMGITDNTTTALTIDFSDTELASGQDASTLFDLEELGECAGTIGYSSRLFWWGERNKLQNMLNLTFDGGFSGNTPLGWTTDPVSGAGGTQDNTNVLWGSAYRITGDGVSALRGMITQSAYQDFLTAPILMVNTAYSVRVRLLKGGTIAAGSVTLELFSATSGSLGTFTVIAGAIGTSYAEFIGPLMAAIATIPADTVLRYYGSGTISNGGYIVADNIEILPTLQPYNNTVVRASFAEDPESYSGVTGFLNVAPENGQSVRAAFVLREKLYFVKEKSLYGTQDDGQNEPDAWAIDQISNVVGTFSNQGVDVGEEWAMIASRQGLYIFWGPEPVKVSQEIQQVWNSINWAAATTLWVKIDQVNRRVLVGVPTGAATSPNQILMFDYRGIDTAQEIADHWTVRYSSYTGKILAIGNAPKWSHWTLSINSACLSERPDGTAHLFLGSGSSPGSGANSGKIYDLLDPQQPGSGGVYNDDGAGIPWTYSTYYGPGHQDEQALKLGSHRKLYGYLTLLVEGSGQMTVSAQPIGNITSTALVSVQLVNVSAPATVTNATRTTGITTVYCAGGHNLAATDTQVVLSAMGDPSFDGTFPIFQILDANNFTIYQPFLGDLPSEAGGTATRLLRDFEMGTNFQAERASYTFSNYQNAANSWFKLEKLVASMSPDPFAPVRGGGG